ncbi:MAG: hypothetical protein CMK09_10210 [Ponticaulis sp.]|nr:hypothetical protein [Ponticaulis sp.]|tara:strand:+ start:8493 stop:8909 length:417 start_codon:yes stop_codon:yes gene_type:complete
MYRRLVLIAPLCLIAACALKTTGTAPREVTFSDLTDLEWRVENLMDAGIPDRAHATLNFTDDGGASGSTGCNQYSGSYKLNASRLYFSAFAVTKRACVGSLMDMEQKFLRTLSGTVEASLDPTGLLRLESETGSLEAR